MTNKTAASLYVEELLSSMHFTWVAEFSFAKSLKRRWRFDYCIPNEPWKFGIEIEGGTWRKSRHTTGKGFRADIEKYNTAVVHYGYRVLRYTPDQILSGALEADLKELCKKE